MEIVVISAFNLVLNAKIHKQNVLSASIKTKPYLIINVFANLDMFQMVFTVSFAYILA